MQAAPSASGSAPPAPAPTEIVHRPEPGTLQRGAYEAPTWAFYVAAIGVVLLAVGYFALRLGALKPKKS